MTARQLIDAHIRPLIGDTFATQAYPQPTESQPARPINQIVKYPTELLLDLLNEGLVDIAENSKFFKKRGVALLKAGDKTLTVPKDFKGLYRGVDTSVGVGFDWDVDKSLIRINPDGNGLTLVDEVTHSDVSAYSQKTRGVILPNEIVELLYESGQITGGTIPQSFLVDLLVDRILITYEYLYDPQEYTEESEIIDKHLIYMLKWWTASRAVVLDGHNEATNKTKLYEGFYLRRLERAGVSNHNWNEISLSSFNLR